jgi:hypothetical protein
VDAVLEAELMALAVGRYLDGGLPVALDLVQGQFPVAPRPAAWAKAQFPGAGGMRDGQDRALGMGKR